MNKQPLSCLKSWGEAERRLDGKLVLPRVTQPASTAI